MNLAFYGTLRDPEVLAAVIGQPQPGRFVGTRRVFGWASYYITGQAYPLLVREAGASALFDLYQNCCTVSWSRLVAYEGSEYATESLLIEGQTYQIFMAEPDVQPSSTVWDLADFQQRHKPKYLHELQNGWL